MNDTAPESVQALLAARPSKQIIANLFTFTLRSGPIYRFTDWRRPVTIVGVTYLPGPPRLQRGTIKLERGLTVDTQEVTLQEANGSFITKLAQGYFNRALYRMDRVFAADATLNWQGPMTRFTGRVNNISEITRTTAKLTIKSLLDDLDNDYPRDVIQPDCNAILFDAKCGVNAAPYTFTGAAGNGSTKNKALTTLTNPDNYFTQGVLTFTGGAMSGISYMVKSYLAGVVVPAYPFLVVPVAGTPFSIQAGCDKSLATCISKFGYSPTSGAAPFFRGTPFVPDPSVVY